MSAKLSPRTRRCGSPPPAQRWGGAGGGGRSVSTNFPPPRLAREGARRPSPPLRGGRVSNGALLESGWRKVAAVSIAVAIALSAATSAHAQTLDEKVQLCAACHGENGVPVDKSVPIIAGQHQGYLYLQLRDYKRGSRKNEIMSPIAETMERDDMMALAEYFFETEMAGPAPAGCLAAGVSDRATPERLDRLHRVSSRRISGRRHAAAPRWSDARVSRKLDAGVPGRHARKQSWNVRSDESSVGRGPEGLRRVPRVAECYRTLSLSRT